MKRVLLGSILVLAGTYGVSAQAQEAGHPGFFEKGVPAPARAFEINASTAYNQGWGHLTDNVSVANRTFGRDVQDVGGAGLAFGLDLGYRVSPMFAFGAYGTFAGYTNQTPIEGVNNRSVTAGIQGVAHFRPYRSLDPWVSLGS